MSKRFNASFRVALTMASALGVVAGSAPRLVHAQTSGLTVNEGAAAPPKFYGLHLDLGIYDGSGLNSVGQNYRNDLSFYFEPTWDIGHTFAKLRTGPFKNLALAARFIVTANIAGTDESAFTGNTRANPQGTCSNLTPSTNGGIVDPSTVQYCNPQAATRRADYSDVWLTLRAPGVYKIPKIGVNMNVALRLILPASEQSRLNTLVASVTPSVGLGRAFWKGRLRAGLTFGVNKNFHTSSTPRYRGGDTGTVTTQGGNPYDGPLSQGVSNFYADPSRQASVGGLNTNFSLLTIVSSGAQFNDKWSADLLYIVSNAFPYGQDCTQNVQGQMIDLCGAGSSVAASSGSSTWALGRRDFQTLWASINYQPWEWIGFSLSWINSAPMLKPDGSYRQGIISTDYNSFTTVSFGTSISIDHVVDTLQQRRKKSAPAPVAQGNGVVLQ